MQTERQANEQLKSGSYDEAYHANCRVSARRAELKEASDKRKVFLFKVVAAIGGVCLAAHIFYAVTG